jgi:hypothetical protein
VRRHRAVLQRVLQGRIILHPREDGGYDLEWPTRFDKLFSGIAVSVKGGADLWDLAGLGVENIRPEDTWDADYEELLSAAERSHAKEVATPAQTHPFVPGGVGAGNAKGMLTLEGTVP